MNQFAGLFLLCSATCGSMVVGCGSGPLRSRTPTIVLDSNWSDDEALRIRQGAWAWTEQGATVAPQFVQDAPWRISGDAVRVRRVEGYDELYSCSGGQRAPLPGMVVQGCHAIVRGEHVICIDMGATPMASLSAVMSHELGHTWGLKHTSRDTSVMKPSNVSGGPDDGDVRELEEVLP